MRRRRRISADSGTGSLTGATTSPAADATTFAGHTRIAIEESERYWNEQLGKNGKTFQPIDRISQYTGAGQVTCGTEEIGSNNAAYCSEATSSPTT